ncbi:MAG TPA: hypothetical protein VFG87_14260 [Amycolatopsis sp.]|nr:hypothetical protein [Amycolatopsis sp.]
MTTSEIEQPATRVEELAWAKGAAAVPAGNPEPYTPPPTAAPAGNPEPYSPPADVVPSGNPEPYSPPADVVPSGNPEPYTPPDGLAPAGNPEPYSPPVAVTPNGNPEPYSPPVAVAGSGNPGPLVPPATANGSVSARWGQGGAWVHNRVITRLWSSSARPGVWVWVDGLGWKRLVSSDSGRSTLTTLAVQAKANGLVVSFHEDDNAQIDQLLV